MKKKYIILILILAVIGTWGSCKTDFLDIKPAGSLDQSLLGTSKGIDALLVGAYSMLDGVSSSFGWEAASTNWVYGSIRGMEANKGTDAGDQPFINPIQTFSETATNDYLNVKWRAIYESVSRCNSAIMVTNAALAAGKIDAATADSYLEQARALRGWYHFEAWRMWEKVPYMDEKSDAALVGNNEDIRPKIIADLTEGTKLPDNMGAIGKFNGTVCKVILAKVMMQMNHDYTGALPLLQSAKTGTKPNGDPIGLAATYGEIFDIANRNKIESVYTVQYSVNDGSGAWNAGWGEVLNFPYKSGGSPGGCCGFFNPTQEFVNSFRTSAAGLPLLDFSYNADPVKNDQGIAVTTAFVPDAGRLDPRLDWSVGRRGIPYWDWGKHTGADWIRDQTYSGPYSPKKQVYKKSQEGQYTEVGNWTSGYTANGYRMIRFADVLLLEAECLIETGNLAGARTNINLIRARAANPSGFVMDGAVPAANYVISQYPASGYPFDTQANARLALYMERKLELGQEGHRYFDLNRWGITVTELNRALTYEKTMPWGNALYLNGAAVVGPEDVTFPIPQRQIDISNGKLVQNR
ncbi:MAG: RagB/SusD family nutrient uptake outer membrane protein [Bacteroidetes bacterium]|nr:MAG: RagB/SusD family nutrient uptake outer membrane protein [Bacteroidota bacterium]